MSGVFALLLGFIMGALTTAVLYQHHIDAGQANCATHGLVFSPRLQGGLDYCVRTNP